MKQLLSLEDLYQFYVTQNKNVKFSSKDSDSTIVVHVDEPFVFESSQDDELNLLTNMRLCHLDENRNQSSISREVMENAMPSAYNMPILGYIWHDEEDGLDKFASHEFYIDDGEVVYEEIPVGCIPESADLKLVENENGKTYLEGTGLIWRTYTKAAQILEREHDLSVSVELAIEELSFNAKKKILQIDAFKFTGVTILQAHRNDGSEVHPGMEGAEISIGDFSQQNNSVFAQKKVMELLEDIRQKVDNLTSFHIDHSDGKEENRETMNKFEELLEKYEKSVEDISFDYENMSDEELEDKFAELFDNQGETPSNDESADAQDNTFEQNHEDNVDDQKFIKTFELSHEDIKAGLYALLSVIEDSDNEWYFISNVYDDSFVYEGFCNSDNIYRQGYEKDGDNVAFVGDRVHLNREFLTDNELAELQAMRSSYEELQSKVQKYEDEPKKIELLESSDYALIADNEEFISLKDQKAHFDLSVEELACKCNEILLNAAKTGSVKFEAKPEKKSFMMLPSDTGKKVGRYGSLFKK